MILLPLALVGAALTAAGVVELSLRVLPPVWAEALRAWLLLVGVSAVVGVVAAAAPHERRRGPGGRGG